MYFLFSYISSYNVLTTTTTITITTPTTTTTTTACYVQRW